MPPRPPHASLCTKTASPPLLLQFLSLPLPPPHALFFASAVQASCAAPCVRAVSAELPRQTARGAERDLPAPFPKETRARKAQPKHHQARRALLHAPASRLRQPPLPCPPFGSSWPRSAKAAAAAPADVTLSAEAAASAASAASAARTAQAAAQEQPAALQEPGQTPAAPEQQASLAAERQMLLAAAAPRSSASFRRLPPQPAVRRASAGVQAAFWAGGASPRREPPSPRRFLLRHSQGCRPSLFSSYAGSPRHRQARLSPEPWHPSSWRPETP